MLCVYNSKINYICIFFFKDMSIFNSEARGCYINIVAGSLGFVGAGASTLVSQLVSEGVNVGRVSQSF